MSKLKYTLKTDTLFKMLFVQYPELLKKLVAELLGIRLASIGHFVITNPEMPPEAIGDKFCRLDIHMTVDGNYQHRRLPDVWLRGVSLGVPGA